MDGYYQPGEHQPEEDATQRPAEAPGTEGQGYSGKDLDLYHVLLAVERGELSVEEAARRLEALEGASPRESGWEPI